MTIEPTAAAPSMAELLTLLEQTAGLRLFIKNTEGQILWANTGAVSDLDDGSHIHGPASLDSALASDIDQRGDELALQRGHSQGIEPLGDRFIQIWKTRIEREGQTYILGGYLDCTERVLSEERELRRLEYEATHDSLTGLLNRGSFYMLLESACQQRRPKLALLYLDLNGFKRINDIQGHLEGDRLLRVVANHLTASVRSGDAVARMGGDEFTVLLPGASSVEAMVVADRISKLMPKDGLTTAMGIAAWEKGDTPDAIVGRADELMFLAKRDGVPCRTSSTCTTSIDLVQALDQALEQGEIVPYFQPIAASRNRRIIGYELLARWVRPGGQVVSPAEFMPILAEARWMSRLDWLMLRAGMRALEHFSDQWLSINISEETLFDAEFSNRLARELESHFASTEFLRLEISESIAISVQPLLEGRDAITQLKNLASADVDIGLLVDDYGSAYAHLLAIMRLCEEVPNVRAIKLVGDLVRNIDNTPAKITICRNAIELAHGLGLETIAEGVETEAELMTLRGLHCDSVQGYYLGVPLAMDEYLP
ncbi:MAG: putative bifunctional diguanylate cyclase/phosphodiesterase [Spirulina sp.]